MKGARILFYDPDPRAVRAAERALHATGSEVDTAVGEAALLEKVEANGYDLLMINFDPPLRDDPKWTAILDRLGPRFPRTRLVLHATARTEDYLPILAERRFLRNLIAKNDVPLSADELIITAEKLLRRDLFGLEKYLLWGVQPHALEIRDSSEKRDIVREVSRYGERLGCNDRTLELIETIVDELATNAIYNAPCDEKGEPRYAKLSRRERVVLAPEEAATLQYACDGDYFAISQSDRFGTLTQETVVSYLNRCLVRGPGQLSAATGGAGIGLFRVFQSLSKFVVNLDPGKRTEVISLIDLRVNMKRFKQQPKSFHIFVNDGGGAQ